MSRPLRIEFAGAFYHVTSRGDRREVIYEEDEDREEFLGILSDVFEGFGWSCHAHCLMPCDGRSREAAPVVENKGDPRHIRAHQGRSDGSIQALRACRNRVREH